MTYQQRWLLAVAMKQGYPRPDTGATAVDYSAGIARDEATKQTQQSLMKLAGVVAAVGVVGYLLMR